MATCVIADYEFKLKNCKNLTLYFPKQQLRAWHCTIETEKYNNPKLCQNFNIWLAGNNYGPSENLLLKALEIRSKINDYIDINYLFDIHWLESLKPHSYYAGIEEIHNFRQEKFWLSGLFLLDQQNSDNFVISELYGRSNYYTLYKNNKPCDKIVA